MSWLLKLLSRGLMLVMAAAIVRSCGSEPVYVDDESERSAVPNSAGSAR